MGNYLFDYLRIHISRKAGLSHSPGIYRLQSARCSVGRGANQDQSEPGEQQNGNQQSNRRKWERV